MKVGDYVRIDGYVSKIGHIKESSSGKIYAQWKQPNGLLASGNIKIIKKSSPRIIDLIEVGDYVNGGKVYEKEKEYIVINSDFGKLFVFMNVYKKNIKSIVTKEQFESMKYKVGDDSE